MQELDIDIVQARARREQLLVKNYLVQLPQLSLPRSLLRLGGPAAFRVLGPLVDRLPVFLYRLYIRDKIVVDRRVAAV